MDLSVSIDGVRFEHPIINAAGTCKQIHQVDGHLRSALAGVVLGGVTPKPRGGNEGQVYWPDVHASLNSAGLPNPGQAAYAGALPAIVARAHALDPPKPVIVNVVGYTFNEYADLAVAMHQAGADFVEVNLGCQNVWENGKQKPILSYDPRSVDELLGVIGRCNATAGIKPRVGVKLSPSGDPGRRSEVAAVVASHPFVVFVTAVNSFPNTILYGEDGLPRISYGRGLAGMSSPALLPIGLSNVEDLRRLLPENVDIIGVGGVTCGKDIRDYQLAGATAVATCTHILDNLGAVATILDEYATLRLQHAT